MKKTLENFITSVPIILSEVLKKINLNENGIVFVVDSQHRLRGSISDGDLRRYILKFGRFKKKIKINSSLINKKPIALSFNSSIEKILEKFNSNKKKITCIPLIDKNKKIVDISKLNQLRSFPLANPTIGDQELSNIIDVVKSGWISSRGSYIQKFENQFSKYLGGGYSVAVTNGTTAIQTGLMALGIGRGDEVILPNFTFGATINAVLNVGAKPVIADVSIKNWTLDLVNIKKKISKKTKAILPVHIYGQCYNIQKIKNFAKSKRIKIIDDCAEALGGKYKNKIVGLENDCSTFSFFANKLITTGEGGMVVFKKEKDSQKARILINQGLSENKKYYHDYAGSNFRMTNMQAAIGVAQLKNIKNFLQERKKIFKIYNNIFCKKNFLILLPKNTWSENSYWLYTLLIKNIGEKRRDQLVHNLQLKGIECRPGFRSLSKMEPFKKYAKGSYNNSVYLSENSISLPTTKLSIQSQRYIIKIFLEECNKILNDSNHTGKKKLK